MADQSMTSLILVRHGESVVTVKRIMGGRRSCEGLSELGFRQAEALRDRWEAGDNPRAEVLFSSPLPRAIETAQVINRALGELEVQIEDDLEELRPGDADGMRFDELEDHFGYIDFRSRPAKEMAPNTETALGFYHRTAHALERVVASAVGKTIVVACHGGVIDVAFRHFLDIGQRGSFDLWTLNTSLTEFRVDDTGDERGRWRLVRYNDHAHLAGLPAESPRI